MPRCDLDLQFSQIEQLIVETNTIVPPFGYENIQYRADLAGLLVVAIAATYENCVKEILFEYANGMHLEFGNYARRHYSKLNSKIRVSDLAGYCELFGDERKAKFKSELKTRKARLLDRSGINIETSYEQILTWRHAFAHSRTRNTTIEEAAKTHKAGKRVLYALDAALTFRPPHPSF